MTSTQAKLSIRNLYKVFGPHPQQALKMHKAGKSKDDIFTKTGSTVAVSDVSLDIAEGEIFVIMGLSGSGKSTLVRLFNRLIEPTGGSVFIDGEDVTRMSENRLRQVRREKISMVFQSFALMPHLTSLQNAAFGLMLAGVSEADRNSKARTALELVGLGAYADSYPDELSGGMRQRVGLARALAIDPDILLMDEAFSALDPLIRTEMQDELISLQADQKRTIIFISHDLDEAMRIGDRIAIMQGGVVAQVGTPDDILNNPANEYVRSFFSEVDLSKVYTAGDLAKRMQMTFPHRRGQDNARSFIKRLRDNDREYGVLLDENRRYLGLVSVDSLMASLKERKPLEEAVLPDLISVTAGTSLRDMLALSAQFPCPVPVVNENGLYRGSVSKVDLLETLGRNTDAAAAETAKKEEAAEVLAAVGTESAGNAL